MLPESGSLTAHMAAHIVLMNAMAPVLALAALRRCNRAMNFRGGPILPGAVQIALLWGWHAPPVLEGGSHVHHLMMKASLLAAATWYWFEIYRVQEEGRWRAIVSLLVTSKLFCLLGVLYVFAPRVLYPEMISRPGAHHVAQDLADQQLAGLLMLIACPATYILAGIWITARWLRELDLGPEPGNAAPGALSGAR